MEIGNADSGPELCASKCRTAPDFRTPGDLSGAYFPVALGSGSLRAGEPQAQAQGPPSTGRSTFRVVPLPRFDLQLRLAALPDVPAKIPKVGASSIRDLVAYSLALGFQSARQRRHPL